MNVYYMWECTLNTTHTVTMASRKNVLEILSSCYYTRKCILIWLVCDIVAYQVSDSEGICFKPGILILCGKVLHTLVSPTPILPTLSQEIAFHLLV